MTTETSPRGADAEAWMNVLVEAVVKQEIEDLDRPHVLLTYDPAAESTFVTGPFVDAAAALAAATRETIYDRDELGGAVRRHEVLPLLSPAPLP